MITSADDEFHLPGPDPFWTETYWFEFWAPHENLSGCIYNLFRPNLGVCMSGVVCWNGKSQAPWQAAYYDYQWHLPHPQDSLRSLALPNGLSITAVDPLRRYDIRYASAELSLKLSFEALLPPHEVSTENLKFVGSAHFDQIGRITGSLDLHGRKIEVDCISIRDRSWGPRRDTNSLRAGYATGMASADHGFLAISVRDGGVEKVVRGFLMRDGLMGALVSGERSVHRGTSGAPEQVWLEGKDDRGRSFAAAGRCTNGLAFLSQPNMASWLSLTEWRMDGETFWGEDQDVATYDQWRATLASRAVG